MRNAEVAKYEKAYKRADYRMGQRRRHAAVQHLSALPRGSYLDVGTGRGEMLAEALALGFEPVQGTEVVDYLIGPKIVKAYAHELPFADGEFDVVSMLDVMEHLLPEDAEAACRELDRVAGKAVLLTVANFSHVVDGVELHINRRPYQDWDVDFRRWFSGEVHWLPRLGGISEHWVVRYGEH